MLTDTGLSEKHWQIISSIFAEFPEIEEKILFGSRAKGTYKKFRILILPLMGKMFYRIQLYRSKKKGGGKILS